MTLWDIIPPAAGILVGAFGLWRKWKLPNFLLAGFCVGIIVASVHIIVGK